ncbi:S-adenosyl-L-methionine-dependent methyltransferase [Apiosordaria backusii]|uniref:S-adenosyl-L-methionine-dependent methyltransferase n=1 Tax=Apiosordaria backusii TaxID=314023 RepID=A0AA39ZPM0_9PEZI|nr:S-adenosyl-L-methionine-dependent methyltransferase [Apiosordaria backusii]
MSSPPEKKFPSSPPKSPSSKKSSSAGSPSEADAGGTATTVEGILPASHWVEQPLNQDDDADSTYDDDAASSTASLTSSIFAYRTLHGRTYHSDRHTDAQYWTPNDDQAMAAGDIIHHLLTLVHDGKLHRAPLDENISRALDVGTGTGIWAIDFADIFTNCEVIGTDLSPIQPSWVPPNLKFELVDALNFPWPFPPNHFDYIHMRYLFGAIPDWNSFIAQAFACTKPGGWVESFEASCVFRSDDGTLLEGSAMDQWGKVFVEAGRTKGKPFDVVGEGLVTVAFREAGFEEVTEWEFKCPIGKWAKDGKLKEIGAYALKATLADVEGWILRTWNQVMGWSEEEVIVYLAHLREQLRDPNVHAYCLMRCVYGRKPLSAA